MTLLLPEQSVRSFDDVDLKALRKKGIKVLFVDIDNTISAYGDTACSKRAASFLIRVRSEGIELVLLTNNTKKHADRVLRNRPDVKMLTFCLKPLPFALRRYLAYRKLKPHQAAALGDQLFTDMLGGKLAGVHTILCGKVSKEERKDTAIMRFMENIVYTRYERQGKIDRRDGYVRIL